MTRRVCVPSLGWLGFILVQILLLSSDVYFSKCLEKHPIKPLVRSENLKIQMMTPLVVNVSILSCLSEKKSKLLRNMKMVSPMRKLPKNSKKKFFFSLDNSKNFKFSHIAKLAFIVKKNISNFSFVKFDRLPFSSKNTDINI